MNRRSIASLQDLRYAGRDADPSGRMRDEAGPWRIRSFTSSSRPTDLGKAKEFYGQLCSWKLEDMPMPTGTYTMVKAGDGPGGGMMTKPSPEVPTAWLPYVEVDSVDATVAKAKKLGAKVMRDKTPIEGMGAFAICWIRLAARSECTRVRRSSAVGRRAPRPAAHLAVGRGLGGVENRRAEPRRERAHWGVRTPRKRLKSLRIGDARHPETFTLPSWPMKVLVC